MWRTLLIGTTALWMACGPAAGSRGAVATTDQAMPEEVLVKSNPSVDTSKHTSTSLGGCGGLFNPCLRLRGPEALPWQGFGCMPCASGSAQFSFSTAVLLLLAFLMTRRSARRRRSR